MRIERAITPQYATKLKEAYDRHSAHSFPTIRLIERAVKQIELKASQWSSLPPIVNIDPPAATTTTTTTTTTPAPSGPRKPLKLFCSYSHNDDELRVELIKHLSMLQRNWSN